MEGNWLLDKLVYRVVGMDENNLLSYYFNGQLFLWPVVSSCVVGKLNITVLKKDNNSLKVDIANKKYKQNNAFFFLWKKNNKEFYS